MKKFREFEHRVYRTRSGPRLMDLVRNYFVPAGPEEFVRQNVLHSLHTEYGYPLSSLLSEEVVERGQKSRRRADVLVVLPARAVSGAYVSVRSANPRPKYGDHPAYSVQRKVLAEYLSGIPGLKLVDLPDELTVNVDGRSVSCRVLGFDFKYGHELALLPPDDPGLPHRIRIRVNGYGMTEAEVEFARRLGIPKCDWREPKNARFEEVAVELLVADSPDHDYSSRFYASENGYSGWFILHNPFQTEFGVLAEMDVRHAGLEEAAQRRLASFAAADEQASEDSDNGEEESTDSPDHDDQKTLIVVECKAPQVGYSDEVLKQGAYYAKKRGARFMVLTSGEWTHTYLVEDGSRMVKIADIPTHAEAIGSDPFLVNAAEPDEPHRPIPPEASSRGDLVRFHIRDRDVAGADTPLNFWRPILALDDLLHSPRNYVETPFTVHGIEYRKDLGTKLHDVSNSSGGHWDGDFRTFLIQRGSDELILGVGLMGMEKMVEAANYGTRKSTTVLLGVLSDDAEIHPVIEYAMDRGMEVECGRCSLRHDGRITIGKGAVSSRDLVEFVQTKNPALVDDRLIDLGSFPDAPCLDWAGAGDFICRFLAYTLLRHEFKDQVRKSR